MARNKHPEETVRLILDTAIPLFMKNGYEHTSIQDITDHLGGLSKGAIYHHFKSKEDLLAAVTDRITSESNQMLARIRDRSDLTGIEKLQAMFRESVCRPVQNDIFTIAPDFHKNPQLLFSLLHDITEIVVPDYMLPIIQEGIEDGTIKTDYPQQLAELILLAANLWMNPMIFESSVEETCAKIMIFRQMMQGFGLNIIDDTIIKRLQELTSIYQKHR